MYILLYMCVLKKKKINEVRGFKVCGYCFGIYCMWFIFLELCEVFYGLVREGKNIFVFC